MAKEYSISIQGHPNIYKFCQREFKLYFCEPENGINEKTGLILLIPGFGASSSSKVYKKQRSLFSDNYNMVTIQCDYFGNEFMQDEVDSVQYDIDLDKLSEVFTKGEILQIYNKQNNNIDLKELVNIAHNYSMKINLQGLVQLPETIENFNDMGIIQALDNITAVLVVIEILKDNNYIFNNKKKIIYGHSHGAYLAYLCNAIAPNLFNLLIDNSAWLFPVYLQRNRQIDVTQGNIIFSFFFDYLAKKNLYYDEELLDLMSLYKKFHNKCKIVCYHGNADKLVPCKYKRMFCELIENCSFNEITNNDVDGRMFKSTEHGLNADYLLLFDYVMNKYNILDDHVEFDNMPRFIELPEVKIETKKNKYIIDYSKGVPILEVI